MTLGQDPADKVIFVALVALMALVVAHAIGRRLLR